MNSKVTGLYGVILIATQLIYGNVACLAQESATLPKIRQVWRDRQDSVDIAHVTWMSTKSLTREHIAGAILRSQPAPDAPDVTLPESQSSFFLAKESARYDSTIASFANGEYGAAVPGRSVYDGRTQQYLTDRTKNPDQHSRGVVGKSKGFDEWANTTLLPLVYALRPLRPEAFGGNSDRWQVDSRPGVIDSRTCIVISSTVLFVKPDGKYVETAYLDAEREFVPLRVTAHRNGTLWVQIDMRYEREGECDWIPSSWTSTWFGGRGAAINIASARDVDVTLNEPIPDETFQLKIGVGRTD